MEHLLLQLKFIPLENWKSCWVLLDHSQHGSSGASNSMLHLEVWSLSCHLFGANLLLEMKCLLIMPKPASNEKCAWSMNGV
jgi:hypothetical protein